MATVIGSMSVAENYQKAAKFGATYGDPINPALGGCLTELDFDTINAGAVQIFYESPLTASDPAAAPADYSGSAAANSLVTIPMNNFFSDLKKMYGAQLSSVPYDKGLAELDKLANKGARQNGRTEIACLITEGTAQGYTLAGTETDEQKLEIQYKAIQKAIDNMRGYACFPKMAIVSPEMYGYIVRTAGAALKSDEANKRLIGYEVGYYNGIWWVMTPMLGSHASGAYKYYNSASSLVTVAEATVQSVPAILIDGEFFVSIERITGYGLVPGEPVFNGVGAVYDNMLGVKLLDAHAAYVVRPNA